MRIPLVAANWKMHKNVQEAVAYAREFAPLVATIPNVDIVVAPPFLALPALVDALESEGHSRIKVAAQNIHAEPNGAFTGEVSLGMLQASGVTFVIVGHSERRQLFHETDVTVNEKTRAAVEAGVTPIVCVGETLEERESYMTSEVLYRQINLGLSGLSPEQVAAIVVAYEPVWAIGTGHVASPDQANAVHAQLRKQLAEQFSVAASDTCRVIYGGSVKPGNAPELMRQSDVDGALVGGASLDPTSFAEIVSASHQKATEDV